MKTYRVWVPSIAQEEAFPRRQQLNCSWQRCARNKKHEREQKKKFPLITQTLGGGGGADSANIQYSIEVESVVIKSPVLLVRVLLLLLLLSIDLFFS